MKYHDAANIFPMLSDAELDSLAKDIEDNGQQEPIELLNGEILDGRNRYEACLMVEVEPEFVEWDGDDPITYVLSRNLHRRHLTESQRAMIAGRYAKAKEVEPEESGRQSDLAAAKLSVSGRSVRSATKVLTNGTKSLQDAVDSNKLSVSAASKVADLPKQEQNKIANSSNPKKEAKEVAKADPEEDWKHHRAKSVKYAEALGRCLGDLNDVKESDSYDVALDLSVQVIQILKGW